MATIEEERAKVDARGISVQAQQPAVLSTTNPVAQGIQNIVSMPQAEQDARLNARMARDTSTFLRTPPNMQNVASSAIFDGQPGGITQTVSPPAPQEQGMSFGMPMSSANLDRTADDIPRSYVAPVGGAPTRGPLTGDAATDIMSAQKFRAEDDAFKKANGQPTWSEFDKSLGFPGKTAAPQEQGMRREVINGNVSTQYGGGQGPKVTVQPGYAPQLKTGFTSPEAFSRVIGYDQNENPIYNDAAAAMRAANEGIRAQNDAAVSKFQQENALYASVNGGIPLQQAQAQLAGTQASELPGENESQQKKRTNEGVRELAQAREADARAEQLASGQWQTVQPEVPGTAETGFQSAKPVYQVNSRTGEQRQVGGISQKGLPEKSQRIVDKYYTMPDGKTQKKWSGKEWVD